MPVVRNNQFVRKRKLRVRKPIFLLTCEGDNKTEYNYFNQFRKYGINIQFTKCNETDIINMTEHHIKECKELDIGSIQGDCSFVLCDMDLNFVKEQKIKKAKELLTNVNAEIIVSNPCFELWYILLCKNFSTRKYNTNNELIKELKKEIPDYTKSKVLNIESFSSSLENAVDKAKKLEQISIEAGRKKDTKDFNPNTDIYKVIEKMNIASFGQIYKIV